MKIIFAPDSFKESMTSFEVAESLEKGFKQVLPDADYVKLPVADGGEGTVQALVDATGGTLVSKTVTGPLGTPVSATYGLLGDQKTAVIEMAEASGLHLVPEAKRNPLITTTRGTGELIHDAIEQGITKLVIGIGGSATNDGGSGMAKALGVKFLDKEGKEICDGGGALGELASIDASGLHPALQNVTIEVACDVDNPLTGSRGASAVFGPQKGATPDVVRQLDQNLKHLAHFMREDLGIEVESVSGAGAAGGLGAGLYGFLGAQLKSGIDIILDTLEFSKQIEGANLIITGEGKIDHQTVHGKTPIGVAKRAKLQQIPVIAIAGSLGEGYELVYNEGIDAVFSIVPGIMSLPEALANGKGSTEKCARNIASIYKLGQREGAKI
jgi:glycerate kinase